MTVVSSKEFVSNEDKYFDLAEKEQVYVRRDNNMFIVTIANIGKDEAYEEVLEPDDDFRRALSAEEFRKRLIVVLDSVDKKFASKCK
jgi:hypothetical protein